jgi:hypothetical protein
MRPASNSGGSAAANPAYATTRRPAGPIGSYLQDPEPCQQYRDQHHHLRRARPVRVAAAEQDAANT